MPIARLIYVKVPEDKTQEAERVWKEECAPMMIKSAGCLSEEMLRCVDSPGEYISYSEWEDQASIDRYLDSEEHEEIRRHTRGLQSGERPVVKRYEVVG
jgi:heme-degrading monooxygenase HmoA